jgi:ABC-type lipoprotein export system ATPase subunit
MSTTVETRVAIDVKDLVKDYRGLRPLRVRQLTIQAGERVAVSGLDAVAAEVLVNLVNVAILPDEGNIRIFGERTNDIADETAWFASLDRFGLVSQRAVLLEASTVRQNLALPFTIGIDCLDHETVQRTEVLAAEVGLAREMLDTPLSPLSIDWRTRVHLAKALATEPKVLLLEHVTAPMSREAVPAFAELVRAIAARRGLTVLAITEDSTFADVVAIRHLRVQGGTGALVSARGWRRWLH